MATKLSNLASTFCFSSNSINATRSLLFVTYPTTTTRIRSFPYDIGHFRGTPLLPAIRAASGPNSPEPTSPQDDLTYLLKLVAGSVFGAALIKYGSAIVPDITKPNITQALLMISTPVVIAVLLLFNGSRKE
ncbi:uncharacterized protein LOC104904530 [Beta vulgaris subsp. vulgaris]|uniref:uncharacterized protein LOC104904530 n=1 Tax=Beta vulgaris subsp. vulgaris TaxID=3555 RepID=UPI002036BD8A|nr:uncharacterized protein LOC104904530 [Beta vulgaris subsp. vulgaris]